MQTGSPRESQMKFLKKWRSQTAMLLAGASLLTTSPAALSGVDVNILIGVPPPVTVVETVPAPRPGYVYAPGYWGWDGNRHVWIRGRAIAERPGYTWVSERWEPVSGRYRFVPGYWEPANSHPGKGYAKGHNKEKHGKGHAKGHN
jgi:hypothetical protein